MESVLSLEYGFAVGPIGLVVFAKLTGRFQLQELTCAEAKSSAYCEFLDLFLSKQQVPEEHSSCIIKVWR